MKNESAPPPPDRAPPAPPSAGEPELRRRILASVRNYFPVAFPPKDFVPGVTPVPVSGRVFDEDDLAHLVDAALDFWLTMGRFSDRFEREFAQTLGVRHAILCNSGSSANLLAISALTSPRLGESALRPGDEVVVPACSFPTTVNAILQNGLTPVYVDVSLPGMNADPAAVSAAVGPRTRALFLTHMMGNPFDLDAVLEIARRHDLWLLEDACDALGAAFRGRPVGTFGALATVSFYPAHHITMGEGGCVLTNRPDLKTLLESFRDWGRDCWCDPGKDNTCGKRFDWQLGDLPRGYDHKYIYSHIGYNLKPTDLQAAVGVAQLKKLGAFQDARRRNFSRLRRGLEDLSPLFLLPEAAPGSDPCWFGFPLAVREKAPFPRNDVIHFLEGRKIATRLLFGGNLTRQPAYQGRPGRIAGPLTNSDFAMRRAFWVGVYPGLTPPMLDYVVESLHEFVREAGGFS